MDLNEIVVFAKVVERGSFVGASRDLGIPKSTVSRKVSELEERLGARLLQRTTRTLSLTDVGHAYYQHAQRVVQELDAAEQIVTRMQEIPRGLLRVTIPLNFGYLGPMLATFLEHTPEVQLEIVCTDRVVDLIEEGFDVAIRAGRLADSTLVARNLGVLKSTVVASPSFLERQGTPTTPEELAECACIAFGGSPNSATWQLARGGKQVRVAMRTRYVVNDFDLVHQAALAGLGVALLPVQRSAEDLDQGKLVRLLETWCSPEVPIHAVYPSTRHLSPKVKAFVDHLQQSLREA